jgi:hypothetical protein
MVGLIVAIATGRRVFLGIAAFQVEILNFIMFGFRRRKPKRHTRLEFLHLGAQKTGSPTCFVQVLCPWNSHLAWIGTSERIGSNIRKIFYEVAASPGLAINVKSSAFVRELTDCYLARWKARCSCWHGECNLVES